MADFYTHTFSQKKIDQADQQTFSIYKPKTLSLKITTYFSKTCCKSELKQRKSEGYSLSFKSKLKLLGKNEIRKKKRF